jgi:hypothetical protein
MDKNANLLPRVIGFDCHPDTFTAALLQGPTPAAAVTEKIFNQVPMAQLAGWAKKHTTAQDLFVLEASAGKSGFGCGSAALCSFVVHPVFP